MVDVGGVRASFQNDLRIQSKGARIDWPEKHIYMYYIFNCMCVYKFQFTHIFIFLIPSWNGNRMWYSLNVLIFSFPSGDISKLYSIDPGLLFF